MENPIQSNKTTKTKEEIPEETLQLLQPWKADKLLFGDDNKPLSWREHCVKNSISWHDTFTDQKQLIATAENGSIGVAQINLVKVIYPSNELQESPFKSRTPFM